MIIREIQALKTNIFVIFVNKKVMALEIERKFLVVDDSYRKLASEVHTIRQAYLSVNPDATVRLRIFDKSAFITVKSRNDGVVRREWEYEIPQSDALEMFESCGVSSVIEKRRYVIDAGNGLKWEVDEFGGRNAGLTIAEIELPSEDCPFPLAPFIGEEVTGDPAYYNSSIAAK